MWQPTGVWDEKESRKVLQKILYNGLKNTSFSHVRMNKHGNTELHVLMQLLVIYGSYQSSEPPGQNWSYAYSLADGLK